MVDEAENRPKSSKFPFLLKVLVFGNPFSDTFEELLKGPALTLVILDHLLYVIKSGGELIHCLSKAEPD